jgi:DNA-binding NarL/FixJ family response regulator
MPSTSNPIRGTRLLLVDDSAEMRRILRRLLQTQEHWIVSEEASDGAEAVAKFEEDKFDAIVLDFQMPGMNGLEAARHITQRSPHTPILMVTLHNSSQLAEQARRVGVRGICSKTELECLVEGVAAVMQDKTFFRS